MLHTSSIGRLKAGDSGSFFRPPDHLDGSFAWVIATRCNPEIPPFVPALGMKMQDFSRLLSARLPFFHPDDSWLLTQDSPIEQKGALEEFDDLLQLLFENMAKDDCAHREIAHLLAGASMGSNHLWQDLGLRDRQALSTLLFDHFPRLAARNQGNMKWKKFFYRELCKKEGIRVCKSPSCACCADYSACFGSE